MNPRCQYSLVGNHITVPAGQAFELHCHLCRKRNAFLRVSCSPFEHFLCLTVRALTYAFYSVWLSLKLKSTFPWKRNEISFSKSFVTCNSSLCDLWDDIKKCGSPVVLSCKPFCTHTHVELFTDKLMTSHLTPCSCESYRHLSSDKLVLISSNKEHFVQKLLTKLSAVWDRFKIFFYIFVT